MAISRPVLIALVAAVLALVGFYATQGSRNAASDGSASVATAPPAERDVAPEKVAVEPKATAAGSAARRRARAEQTGVPVPVARALQARRTIVLLFRGEGSADDRATARAVDRLRGKRGVVVFSDRIGRLGRYRGVVGGLGVSQAPAVVIVDRAHSARVVQGYVDPATLAQDVADSR